MSARFLFVVLMACVAIGSPLVVAQGGQPAATRDDHIAWVADALKRMQTIKPGMTRKELLVVFTTEGGLSTALRRTFVSKDCPYFKVDVEFEAVGRPGRDAAVESDLDRIVRLSTPYLQFSIMD